MASKSLADFLLDSGLTAAIDTLTDRRAFVLDDAKWRAFYGRIGSAARG